MKQLALPVQLRASSVFATFFAGSNSIAVARLLDLSGSATRVTWLFGSKSVGKTHLLQAVCANASATGKSAGYFALSDKNVQAEMLTGCEELDFVCLDDFERVAGIPEWERAVFRLYTALDDSGGRLLIAAEVAPTNLQISLRDLASRLAASTLFRIHELMDDEREAALRLRATQMGLELPAEVAQYMLRRLPRDMASLCDALDRLDRASLVTQRALTIPFVKSALENDGRLN